MARAGQKESTCQKATEKKIGDAQRGKKKHSGWHHSEETKKKLGDLKRGVAFSEIHLQNLSLSHRGTNAGSKNSNWKGGVSKKYKQEYRYGEYKDWRKAVFKRDNYTCQMCGAYGGEGVYITAHHIKSFAHYPEERYNILNGLTLCEVCHSKTDNYKGRNKRRI